MGYLRIDYDQAQTIINALKNNADARNSDIQTLTRQASPQAIWEGAAAAAYEDKFEQWKSAETNLVNALEQLADIVQKIKDNLYEIDQNGAAAMPA